MVPINVTSHDLQENHFANTKLDNVTVYRKMKPRIILWQHPIYSNNNSYLCNLFSIASWPSLWCGPSGWETSSDFRWPPAQNTWSPVSNDFHSQATLKENSFRTDAYLFLKFGVRETHSRLTMESLKLWKKKETRYQFSSLKFVFSNKATKFDNIFTIDLTLCSKCQIDGEDFRQFLWPSQKIQTLPYSNFVSVRSFIWIGLCKRFLTVLRNCCCNWPRLGMIKVIFGRFPSNNNNNRWYGFIIMVFHFP